MTRKQDLQKKFQKLLPVVKLASFVGAAFTKSKAKAKTRSSTTCPKTSPPKASTCPAKPRVNKGWTENDLTNLRQTVDTSARMSQGVHLGFNGALVLEEGTGEIKVVDFGEFPFVAGGDTKDAKGEEGDEAGSGHEQDDEVFIIGDLSFVLISESDDEDDDTSSCPISFSEE